MHVFAMAMVLILTSWTFDSCYCLATQETTAFLSVCPSAILQRKKLSAAFSFFFNHILHMKLTSWKLLAHTMSLLLQDKMCHCSICYSFADESVRQHAAEQNIPKKKKLCSPTDLALTELGPGLINHFAALLTVPGKTLGLPLGSNISGAC